MSARAVVGAATAQFRAGWDEESMIASFGGKLEALFLLAALTLEADGGVVPSAMPMNTEAARAILAVEVEWNALTDALIRLTDPPGTEWTDRAGDGAAREAAGGEWFIRRPPAVVVELLGSALRGGEFPDTRVPFSDDQGGKIIAFLEGCGYEVIPMEARSLEERAEAQRRAS